MIQTDISPMKRRYFLSGYFFLTGIAFASWASRIPDIKLQLGMSDAAFGAILFFLPIGSFSGIPISGSLNAKFGSNTMLKWAAFLYPLALINLGLAQTKTHLAIAMVLFGMIGNLYNVSVNTQAVQLAKQFEKSIMSAFHGFWSLAGFSGGLIGGFFVARSIAPLTQFIFIALVSYSYIIFTMQYLLPGEKSTEGVKKLWVKPSALMWQFGFIALSNMVCEGMMFDWSGVYFQNVVKVSTEWRTTGYISFMACMASGRMIADRLINYWGPRKQLIISGILVALGLCIATLYPHLIVSSIGFMLVGFGVSSVIPTIYGIVGKNAAHGQASTALASVSSVGFLGFLIGPPIIGFLSEAMGMRWAFLTIAILGITTTLQSLRLDKNL
jgi:MFS family permease